MQSEAKDLVDKLNLELWGDEGKTNTSFDFVYMTNTVDEIIEFHGPNLEISLWSSLNDEREILDSTEDLEPLEEFVREKYKETISNLVVINELFNPI